MSPRHKPVRFALNNDLCELDRLAQMLDMIKKKWRLTDKLIIQLNLVLDELFTNIVSYGYAEGAKEQITFILDLEDDEVRVTIHDSGKPFDPTIPESPVLDIPLGDKHVGGLGIFLARQYTDTFDYRREGNKNIVTLTKKF